MKIVTVAAAKGVLDVLALMKEVRRVRMRAETVSLHLHRRADRCRLYPAIRLCFCLQQADNADYQWWCCDALAGLCAGNGELMCGSLVMSSAVDLGSGLIGARLIRCCCIRFAEKARADLYVQNGVASILAAMRLFNWDENVQTKANWLLAILAANYSDYLGKQGAVEIVVDGMRACEESYQVQISGTRCLQNLVGGHEGNGIKARAAGK